MSRAKITTLLLVVLCIAIGYAWIATPKQRRVAPGQKSPQKTSLQQQKVTTADFPIVADLDFSGGEENQYQKPLKNLFAPLYLPPKVVKRPPTPRSVIKVTKPANQQVVVPVVIQPQGPKPIQPLAVLGYLSKTGEYTVFLASKQGEIFLVKTGSTFADDLIVHSINAKEITIGHLQTDQQLVLRLGEAKNQRLPKVSFKMDRPKFKTPKEPKISERKSVKNSDMNNKKVKNDDFR